MMGRRDLTCMQDTCLGRLAEDGLVDGRPHRVFLFLMSSAGRLSFLVTYSFLMQELNLTLVR